MSEEYDSMAIANLPLNRRTLPSSLATLRIEPVIFHYKANRANQPGPNAAHRKRLTSTLPTVTSPLPHSATTSPRHADCCCCPLTRCCSPSSADAAGGTTFHTLTVPSRCPLAIKWYDLPHAGAHESEVIACEPRP